MANLLELAEKMGIKSDSLQDKKEKTSVVKRRPWLEEDNDQSSQTMTGINISQSNIPTLEEPVKRKHIIRLDELSDAYSNPDLKKNADSINKGELKKPDALKNLDQKLERVEAKTEKLLMKASKRELANHNQVITSSTTSHNKKRSPATKKQPSYLEFLCLKGIPKAIARHISSNMHFDEALKKNICVIDSTEILESLKKPSSMPEIANAIYRMQASGWFKTMKHSNAGTRVVEIINPEFYRS